MFAYCTFAFVSNSLFLLSLIILSLLSSLYYPTLYYLSLSLSLCYRSLNFSFSIIPSYPTSLFLTPPPRQKVRNMPENQVESRQSWPRRSIVSLALLFQMFHSALGTTYYFKNGGCLRHCRHIANAQSKAPRGTTDLLTPYHIVCRCVK
jgi:hypothetical protein